MPKAIRLFVHAVEAMNRVVGRFAMYLIFVMPAAWTLESAQFLMVAYFLLGGAYSMQLDAHVRMDLFYSRWAPRTRAVVDVLTIGFLIFYLAFLLYGGISSTQYALEYDETSYSAWSPPMAPIKIVMCIGIVLMLLQAIATLFKDIAAARGETL
jgi:TRAP-type mannitol/chloroaromatic compound transport system permease small subunit